jgi:transposase
MTPTSFGRSSLAGGEKWWIEIHQSSGRPGHDPGCDPNPTTDGDPMLALRPDIVEAVWQAVAGHLPEREEKPHPFGCHRRRVADRDCFEAILFRLVTGCSWDVAGRLGKGGETTLRRRRDEWLAAGVFDALVAEALHAYDRVIGLDLSEVAIDGSFTRRPVAARAPGRAQSISYDVTLTCFETHRIGTGALISLAHGHSRDQREDRPTVVVSLLVTSDGIPIAHHVFAGNTSDVTTLAGVLEDLRTGYSVGKIVLVADRGLISEENLAEVAAHGFDRVIATRLHNDADVRDSPTSYITTGVLDAGRGREKLRYEVAMAGTALRRLFLTGSPSQRQVPARSPCRGHRERPHRALRTRAEWTLVRQGEDRRDGRPYPLRLGRRTLP